VNTKDNLQEMDLKISNLLANDPFIKFRLINVIFSRKDTNNPYSNCLKSLFSAIRITRKPIESKGNVLLSQKQLFPIA